MLRKYIEKYILTKINKFEELDGWLSKQEGIGLYETARKLGRKAVVVEIGTWQGKSTYCISKGLKSGYVHAIDPFNADAGLDINSQREYTESKGNRSLLTSFKMNMERLGVYKKIIVKEGYSSEFHNDFNKIDFLFIDGDHSIAGCKLDFELYAPKIASEGFIAFHDYYEERNELGPTFVIKNLVLNSPDFKFYKQYDSLWIAKKQ